MNSIIYPFSLPIYQNFINKESFDVIKNDTYNFISNSQSQFSTPWDSPTKTSIKSPKHLNINSVTLESQIKLHINNYYKVWNFQELYKLELIESWVNIAQKGDYQEEHNHNDCLFSGVIYINTNESSGDFNIINPLSLQVILMGFSSILPPSYRITPKDSMIILFPGWLNHRVSQNKSNEDRISISFNIKRI